MASNTTADPEPRRQPGSEAGGGPAAFPQPSAKRWLALIVLLALCLRLGWVAYAKAEPTFDDDTGRYDFWAQSLAHGHDFVNYVSGEPTAFVAPGYPILLGALYFVTGRGMAAGQALNVALGAVAIVLVFALGRRVGGQAVGLLAAFLVATSPSQIFFTSLILNEVLFTTLFLFIVLLVLWESERGSWQRLLALGLLLGYATLVRGEVLLMLAVVFVFWGLALKDWRVAARRSAVVGLLIVAVITPWTIRNWVQMNALIPLTTHGGVTLWVGHHPGADGRFQPADELVFRYPDLTTTQREVRVNNDGFHEAIDFAVHHPLDEVTLTARKLFWMYSNDEEAIRWNEAHGSRPLFGATARKALLVLSNADYLVIVALFLAGAGLWFSRRPARLLVLLILPCWTLAHIAFIGDSRYHFPIMPLVTIGAASLLVSVWTRQTAFLGGRKGGQ